MNTILTDIYSLYDALLFCLTPDFGPKLATALLFLAIVALVCFLCYTAPQAICLRAALNSIRAGSDKETPQQKRATFQTNFEEINTALLSNNATSIVWQEFSKTLLRR